VRPSFQLDVDEVFVDPEDQFESLDHEDPEEYEEPESHADGTETASAKIAADNKPRIRRLDEIMPSC
jgi:hypothetical protein